ncbi:MAG: hypothetical protein K0V04_21015 [Deltaproteobacteria bacterium]|nr:hypothetical protein [Deltaproteobacteria bacterium]
MTTARVHRCTGVVMLWLCGCTGQDPTPLGDDGIDPLPPNNPTSTTAADTSSGDDGDTSGGMSDSSGSPDDGSDDTTSGSAPPDATGWEARSTAPGVVMATRFDTQAEVTDWLAGATQDHVSWDQQGQASGEGCLRMDITSSDGAASGDWSRWLADDQREFSTGDEFFVSYRQFVPAYFASHQFLGGGGWKQSIISRHAASMNGVSQSPPYGSNQLYEIVMNNAGYRGLPQGYNRNRAGQFRGWDEASNNACSAYDFRLQAAIDHGGAADDCASVWARYGGLYSYYSQQGAPDGRPNPAGGEFPYAPDEWMGFKIRVVVGTFETSGDPAQWANDTLIQVWAAREGAQAWTLIHDKDPANGNGVSIGEDQGGSYDALWLLPYDTGKQPDPSREDTYTLYDEVIVSTHDIAVP